MNQGLFLDTCAKRAAVAALCLSVGLVGMFELAHAAPEDARPELVYVGTQQSRIMALRFDPAAVRLTPIGTAAQGVNATWVQGNPQLPIVYAVDDDRKREGSVTAYAANRETGALTELNRVDSRGVGTTYLSLDKRSKTLFAASYNSATVSSIALEPDGRLGALASAMRETGSGPDPRRQAGAHAHSAVADPSGRHVLVPDLGADRVFVYGFDGARHALLPDDGDPPRAFAMPPGSGPRHLVFGAGGNYAYVITELSAEIFVLRWDAAQGRLAPVQTVALSSPQFKGVKSGAEIGISADGRFVYAQDRGENMLVAYRVDPASGRLSEIQRIACGGARPWGMALDPSGKWLFTANQQSGNVAVFRVDAASGRLSGTEAAAEVPTATSVAFVN
jgi:6-phosphogluconolactonase (cycloisomerase 2 family)